MVLEIGQEFAKLLPHEHWRFGDNWRFGDAFGSLAMPHNSVIECPRNNLFTGLESLCIAQ